MTAPVALECQNLSITLGTYPALEEVNFALPERSFLAILGPNGGGKSTLIRAAMGLVAPTSGTVRLFGGAPGGGGVGYVPQIKTLDRNFPALPLELVVCGLLGSWPWLIRRADREVAMQALARAGMAGKELRPVGRLSGGELQRVYLARALVRQPRLVILDEPATGMDVMGEADMYHILEQYRAESGATVVMVTHDWDVASHHATHVLLLNRRSEAFGPPAETMTAEHLRRAFGHVGHKHPMIVPEEQPEAASGGHDHHHAHGTHDHGHSHGHGKGGATKP